MGDEKQDRFTNSRIEHIRSRLPKKTDANVTEILGILIGDGWLGVSGNVRKRKQVCFCGNLAVERKYRQYVQRLIRQTLNVNGYYQERKDYNTYYIIINSDGIFDFFQENYDFPVGPKTFFNVERLPDSWHLQKRVIRGIFDTDGSVFFDRDHRYRIPYPVLDITLKNMEMLDWIAKVLEKQGFRVIKGSKCIRLKGSKNIHKWFKYIAPKNDLHKDKYSSWIKEYCMGP